MAESLRNTTAAYNKGALAYVSSDPASCPYGWNKLQLSTWWYAGLNDAKNKCLDMGLIRKSNERKLAQFSRECHIDQ